MKLWLLRPVGYPWDYGEIEGTPWDPWYDKCFGAVVRAPDEQTARVLLQEESGDECYTTKDGDHRSYVHQPMKWWLDPDVTTCVELLPDGESEVIVRDFAGT